MNTKNNKNNNNPKNSDSINGSYLSESLRQLAEIVSKSFVQEANNALHTHLTEAGKPFLSFQEELQKGKLHKEIKRMARALKKCTENTPTTTAQFTDTVTLRLENFLYVVQEVEEYPIEKVSDSLEQMLRKQEIESHSVKSFLKKFKKALINIMIKHYFTHEQVAFDLLIEQELKILKVDYVINNKALQFLEPQKYKQYISSLNKGFNALYHDMKAFTDFSNPFFAAADKLFQNIIAKLNQAAGIEPINDSTSQSQTVKYSNNNYPSHIFRRYEDFQLFDTLMQTNPKAEEIGFIFRTMSEEETPKKIVVKETVFRNWFNEESGYKMELKNPIKTLDRIKDKSSKVVHYKYCKTILKG